MKNLIILVFIVMTIVSSLTASNSLTIEGTGDSQELLRELANAYEKKYPNNFIIIPNSVGSSGGIKKLMANQCELSRVARLLKQKEKEKGLKNIIFGYSPIVFVINADTKDTTLSEKNIIDIFQGDITDWDEIANIGLTGKIYIVNREQGDSSRKILDKNISAFKKIEKPAGTTAFYNQEAVRMLTKNKNTIGYLAIANTKNTNLKIVKFDGLSPTLKNIKNGKYKLVTPLGLVYRGKLNRLAKDFIVFLKSKEAKKIMHNYGVVSNL